MFTCNIGFIFVLPFVLSDDFPYPKDAPSSIKDCRDVIFNCDCGNPGYKFQAVIKQCHFWMPPEQACVRFLYCLECENGVDRCAACPHGRYGRWCNGECNCKNGGKCNTKDGTCICSEGYEGDNCETRKILMTGELNCNTKAKSVMSKPGVLTRITCPPGCQNGQKNVWGTSIYRDESSICQSAIHAGVLSNNGGTTFLVNNGLYKSFVKSSANRISSEEWTTESGSFRFSTPVTTDDSGKRGCPPNWSKSSEDLCLLPANPETAWQIASGRCR